MFRNTQEYGKVKDAAFIYRTSHVALRWMFDPAKFRNKIIPELPAEAEGESGEESMEEEDQEN